MHGGIEAPGQGVPDRQFFVGLIMENEMNERYIRRGCGSKGREEGRTLELPKDDRNGCCEVADNGERTLSSGPTKNDALALRKPAMYLCSSVVR
jgi:hypothetical protein